VERRVREKRIGSGGGKIGKRNDVVREKRIGSSEVP
jgi:hypothetical protein